MRANDIGESSYKARLNDRSLPLGRDLYAYIRPGCDSFIAKRVISKLSK